MRHSTHPTIWIWFAWGVVSAGLPTVLHCLIVVAGPDDFTILAVANYTTILLIACALFLSAFGELALTTGLPPGLPVIATTGTFFLLAGTIGAGSVFDCFEKRLELRPELWYGVQILVTVVVVMYCVGMKYWLTRTRWRSEMPQGEAE